MIIRCPQCEHSRSITENKIPSTAELATCPKCKHRFRFRTLRREPENDLRVLKAGERNKNADTKHADVSQPAKEPLSSQTEIIRPQSAFRETAAQRDIWDAVDALHHRWQSQLDQHVVEIDHPAHDAKKQEPSVPEVTAAPADTIKDPDEKPASPVVSSDPPFPPEPLDTAPPFAEAVQKTPPPESPPARHETLPLFSLEEQPGKIAAPDEQMEAEAAPAPENPMAAVSKGPVVFPYGPGMEDAGDAEERVNHDMEMLKDASPARPLRDLGRLREFSEFEAEPEGGEAAWAESSNGIPWENPALHGWLKGFMATVHGVMFRAPEFFARFSGAGSLAPGYLFFLVLGYISILGAIVWSQAATALLPELPSLLSQQMSLPVLLLLAPVALGLMLLFVTGFIRLGLRLFEPAKADFALIYKVVGYSVAPFVLSVVPFVGPPLAALWFIASLMLGCRYALGLSWKLAVSMPLLPAVMLLGGLISYFL